MDNGTRRRWLLLALAAATVPGWSGRYPQALGQPPTPTRTSTAETGPSLRPAGFLARSRSTARGTTSEGRVTYDHHHLRIDHGDQTTSIIDLHTGTFTLILHRPRAYASMTVGEMKQQRASARRESLEKIRGMPPRTRALLEEQMKAQDEAMSAELALSPTGGRDRVDALPCRVVAWTSPQGKGRACLVDGGPVDLASWRADGRAFGARLRAAGIGSGALALPVLLLAPHGFPLRVRETTRLGSVVIETVTEYFDLAPRRWPAAHFRPPAGYDRRPLEALMKARP